MSVSIFLYLGINDSEYYIPYRGSGSTGLQRQISVYINLMAPKVTENKEAKLLRL